MGPVAFGDLGIIYPILKCRPVPWAHAMPGIHGLRVRPDLSAYRRLVGLFPLIPSYRVAFGSWSLRRASAAPGPAGRPATPAGSSPGPRCDPHGNLPDARPGRARSNEAPGRMVPWHTGLYRKMEDLKIETRSYHLTRAVSQPSHMAGHFASSIGRTKRWCQFES